jgi:DNA-binding transcriptional MerR regulator
MAMPGVEAAAELPWTVAEFSARTAVPATTLRYWDDEGLLTAHRLDNGHRRYGPRHLPRLEMVRMCQALGCTMDEVRLILDAPDPLARADYARRTLPQVLRQIQVLQVAAQVLQHISVCEHQDADSCGAWMRAQLADLTRVETPVTATEPPTPRSSVRRTSRVPR